MSSVGASGTDLSESTQWLPSDIPLGIRLLCAVVRITLFFFSEDRFFILRRPSFQKCREAGRNFLGFFFFYNFKFVEISSAKCIILRSFVIHYGTKFNFGDACPPPPLMWVKEVRIQFDRWDEP